MLSSLHKPHFTSDPAVTMRNNPLFHPTLVTPDYWLGGRCRRVVAPNMKALTPLTVPTEDRPE
jgi:hypothetical protein